MADSPYTSFRMQRLGSLIIVQPFAAGKVAGNSLTCDLRTGTVAVAEHAPIEKDYTVISGVIGLTRLKASAALAVITESELVAVVRGSPVYKIKSAEVMGDLYMKEAEHSNYLKLLDIGLDNFISGYTLYFSYDMDLTVNQQRLSAILDNPQLASKPLWTRADNRFFWNRHLASMLLDNKEAGCDKFVMPIMVGFVGQLTNVELGRGAVKKTATLTLIARRSVGRAGTRYWRRGADSQGKCANFVESEQLVTVGDEVISSFIQVRGSIPILWSQAPNIKYKPTTYIGPVQVCQQPFDRHISDLLETYKEVTALNLANQHGSEGKLVATYSDLATTFCKTSSGFRLVNFDFHKECGATNYARLSLLWEQIIDDFERFGYFLKKAEGVAMRQAGVFRTNCVDSLDRTNVVQGQLGRRQLEHLFIGCGLMTSADALATAYPQFDHQYKNLWADHGDEISRQYAGTGALKSAFTRTGKRDIWGLMDDGIKSVMRYYLNNFQDGKKQDALEVITGSFQIDPATPNKFKRRPSATLPFMVALFAFLIGAKNLSKLSEVVSAGALAIGYLATAVVLPWVFGATVVALVMKFGRRFVNTPHLRPDLVKVWQKE